MLIMFNSWRGRIGGLLTIKIRSKENDIYHVDIEQCLTEFSMVNGS